MAVGNINPILSIFSTITHYWQYKMFSQFHWNISQILDGSFHNFKALFVQSLIPISWLVLDLLIVKEFDGISYSITLEVGVVVVRFPPFSNRDRISRLQYWNPILAEVWDFLYKRAVPCPLSNFYSESQATLPNHLYCKI